MHRGYVGVFHVDLAAVGVLLQLDEVEEDPGDDVRVEAVAEPDDLERVVH